MRLRPGLRPDPAGGAYSTPRPPSWIKGGLLLMEGEGREGERRGGERKGREWEGKRGRERGREGKGSYWYFFFPLRELNSVIFA